VTTLDGSLVTSHTVTITGLTASTIYHYHVSSSDSAGNATTSGDQSFTTAAIAGPVTPTDSSNDDGHRCGAGSSLAILVGGLMACCQLFRTRRTTGT
jgi:hypothetical protein